MDPPPECGTQTKKGRIASSPGRRLHCTPTNKRWASVSASPKLFMGYLRWPFRLVPAAQTRCLTNPSFALVVYFSGSLFLSSCDDLSSCPVHSMQVADVRRTCGFLDLTHSRTCFRPFEFASSRSPLCRLPALRVRLAPRSAAPTMMATVAASEGYKCWALLCCVVSWDARAFFRLIVELFLKKTNLNC